MQELSLTYPAGQKLTKYVGVQVGVVSSGDMEVLFVPDDSTNLEIEIVSSADNSAKRWQDLFERLSLFTCFPAGKMQIHDFGATPGVARLRIEQSFEEALYA